MCICIYVSSIQITTSIANDTRLAELECVLTETHGSWHVSFRWKKKPRVLLGGCFVLFFAPKSRQCHRHLSMKMKNEL